MTDRFFFQLGIVTSIAIAFKLYVSYQRFQEAREQWTRLTVSIRNLARLIWFNVPDGLRIRAKAPPPTQIQVEQKLREDVLAKASVIRLLGGFAFALKHHLREEYGIDYTDIRGRVGYLPTFARHGPHKALSVSQSIYQSIDPEKGLPAIPTRASADTGWVTNLFSNTEEKQKQKAKTTIAQQNLPLEILSFLGSYADSLNCERKMEAGLCLAFHDELRILNDVLGRCERLTEDSMPLSYMVIISQIKWLFLLLLPFQLLQAMSWITIPAVLITAFTLLSLSSASTTLSHPFSPSTSSPNTIPLDNICANLSIELDTICSSTHQPISSYSNYGVGMAEKGGVGWMYLKGNRPLAPLVKKDFAECVKSLSLSDILEVMGMKVEMPELEK
ncbi:hypothetical protein ABW19_dt0202439 [Dactylella cylindrospora]|nr:hypothetical protein ABW19_dt0202439 [Dactylella cylindrospora]